MIKSFKYRIFPNTEQETIFAKHFGSCRFVYNFVLDSFQTYIFIIKFYFFQTYIFIIKFYLSIIL